MSTLVIPESGTYRNLQEHQQTALRTWLANCQAGADKVGLWIYGNHGEGSTYIATAAMKRMVREVDDDWDYISAQDLMDQIRMSWSAGEVSRHNAGDYDLYVESAGFEDAVAKLWTVKLLWVDDLYDEHDMDFFRKHVLLRLIKRVKDGLPTVIATNMTPESPPFIKLTKVIETWFVTCYAER